jgi:hypothetical protein
VINYNLINIKSGTRMENKENEISFIERRRVPIRGLIGAIIFGIIAIQGFRMNQNGLAYIMTICAVWYLGIAWLNRKAGTQILMTLKEDGIQFFNADGIVPYTAIEGLEIESYNGMAHVQYNSVFHIFSEKSNTLPNFNDSRFKVFFKMPSARKGKGFRKSLVVFNYGRLKTLDGINVNADDLSDELVYRIQKANEQI